MTLSGLGPATLVLEDATDWSVARSAILRRLAVSEPGGRAAHMRIRSGLILSTDRLLSGIAYGPFVEGEGRSRRSISQQRKVGLEYDLDRLLREKLSPADSTLNDRPSSVATFVPRRVLGHDTYSFSNIDSETLETLVRMAEIRPHVVAYGRFDPDDRTMMALLWDLLVPVSILSSGRILESLEDAPEIEDWGRTPRLLNPTQSHVGQAIFYEGEFDQVYVDERALGWDIPPPLIRHEPQKTYDTPIGVAMSRAEDTTTTRISGVDDASLAAKVSRTLYFHEFPNPNAVERKVKGYLLSKTQKEQKWLAFANHGFLDVGDTALVIASLLSSVFFTDFPSTEIRPTADGALQFTVPVLLQSYRGYLPLTTSWSYRDPPDSMNSSDLGDGERPGPGPATGLWMGTAFYDHEAASYAAPLRTPFNSITRDWAGLIEHVAQAAADAASTMRANAYSATGWLWIPQGAGRQEDFYRWTRSHFGGPTFTRRAVGGRVTTLNPLQGVAYAGESEWSSGLRLAQVLLGIAGIRSFVQLHLD